MTRGHARTSIGLGGSDPRNRRGQGAAFNRDVQVGNGLTTDREGRVAIEPVASVEPLPDMPTLEDVADRVTKMLDAFKRGGMMKG